MRSRPTLRHWIRSFLPEAGTCAPVAGWHLVRALWVDFTTNLTQLARQTDRESSAKVGRCFFSRWLDRDHWEPEQLYAHLSREARRVLARRGCVALLLDFTYMQHDWAVLQVSLGWQHRALPLYRAVIARQQAEQKGGEAALLRQACAWLQENLPVPRSRYRLVMDRGMPSHALIRTCTTVGWRFVFRVRREGKMTHPAFTGALAQDVDRVARFLAWGAVYEWWLAHLWVVHRLPRWRPQCEVKGRLSWITITRLWLQRQIRHVAFQTLDCL